MLAGRLALTVGKSVERFERRIRVVPIDGIQRIVRVDLVDRVKGIVGIVTIDRICGIRLAYTRNLSVPWSLFPCLAGLGILSCDK
jgi:hypothetical protein